MHGVKAEFMTLTQLVTDSRLSEGDGGELIIYPDGKASGAEVKVSVAYFRAGYAPTDYPSEAEWRVRASIENSAVLHTFVGIVPCNHHH